MSSMCEVSLGGFSNLDTPSLISGAQGTLAPVAFSFPLQIDRHTKIYELLQQRCVFFANLGHFQDLKAWWFVGRFHRPLRW